ncbi:MAG: hypothetical protein JW990_21310, partial [Thermoleophilia bacterium]|nr:hypothetical protein [Thermoleophilia bacterium]
MILLSPERIREAAPQVRTFLRKVALTDTERWITSNMPQGSGLPPARVLAIQVTGLRDAVRRYLVEQEARFIAYVREHPPEAAPIADGALASLPPEAVLTYHVWLEGLLEANRTTDRELLAGILRDHLSEAIGTGGEAARRQAGALAPGYGRLTQKEARALLRRMTVSVDIGAQAFRRALEDRAHNNAVRGVALRDGAGRVIAAATFSTRGETLEVRYLGALETVVPGAGIHMLRELAGLAAEQHKPIALVAPAESAAALLDMGFTQGALGRFTASADSALALAQSAPGPSAAWTRAGRTQGLGATIRKAEGPPNWASRGWLEGAARTFTEVTGDTTALEAELVATWPTATANFGQAQAALANFRNLARDVALENITAEEAAALHLYILRAKDGTIDAVALVKEVAGKPLYGVRFGARVGRTGAGREMMRHLCGLESAQQNGFLLNSTESAQAFYERLGMRLLKPAEGWTGAEYFFGPEQAQAFASGLTRGMTFVGELSWELAVAGAAEYLENIIIPGVVDTVSATTHRQLVDALIEGLARGEGTNDLIARIRAIDETAFGLVRAERIARTEAITANRAGAHQIAVAAGATEKRWSARMQPNTRDWHREAHGQVVPIDKPFEVANRKGELEYLMFPGDRSLGASAENVINCMCASLTMKPGVSDPATYKQYGAAPDHSDPGPVVAVTPEPVRKAGTFTLEDLRTIVAKDKGWAPGPNAGWKRTGETEAKGDQWTDTEYITNSGRKTVMGRVRQGQVIDAKAFHKSVWEEDDGLVPVVYDVATDSLHFPNAGRGDADHGNFFGLVHGDDVNPDLAGVRGNLDMNTGAIEWYDFGSQVDTIAEYAEMHPKRAENTVKANLRAATQSLFYVKKLNGRPVKVKHSTLDIAEAMGWDVGKRLYVYKAGKWAPGPNAHWRRLDEPYGWDKPTRIPTAEDMKADSGRMYDWAVTQRFMDEMIAPEDEWIPGITPDYLEEQFNEGGLLGVSTYYEVEAKELVQTTLTNRLVDDPDFLSLAGVSPDDPLEVRQEAVGTAVRKMVAGWAETSADHDTEAIVLQEAARAEFGLVGTRRSVPSVEDGWPEIEVDRYKKLRGGPAFDGYRAFARAQYDATQKMLKDAGVTEVVLWRGGRVEAGTTPAGVEWGLGPVQAKQNPLTSWSTQAGVAMGFIDYAGQGDATAEPAIMVSVVPAERILSTPATGMGCLSESEAVILGGPTETIIMTQRHYHTASQPAGYVPSPLNALDDYHAGRQPAEHLITGERIAEGAKRVKKKAALPTIEIDGPESEDWIKEVTRRRAAAGIANAWADAVFAAIAKNKGWAPGPNAGWKRRDDGRKTGALTVDRVDAKLKDVRDRYDAEWAKAQAAGAEERPLHPEWWKEVEPEPVGARYPAAVSDEARSGGYADAQRFRASWAHGRVWMKPGEYLRVVDQMFSDQYGEPVTSERLLWDTEGIDALRERIRNSEELAIPWLDFDGDEGRLAGQEGRHRALAAMFEGVDLMPVDIAMRYDRKFSESVVDQLRDEYGLVCTRDPDPKLVLEKRQNPLASIAREAFTEVLKDKGW